MSAWNYVSNIFWCWRFCRKTNSLVPNDLYVSDLIEYAYVLLDISSDDVLISASVVDIYPVTFTCKLLTLDIF